MFSPNTSKANTNDDNVKYTCRFEVQIDNENSFQVARRLIGAKGCNMKRIIETCGKGASYENIQDVVKLRLRGKGSGFKEGPKQEESNEPLHLCISCRYHDKYKLACKAVEELIEHVYSDYRRFCDKHGMKQEYDLKVKKQESFTGGRRQSY